MIANPVGTPKIWRPSVAALLRTPHTAAMPDPMEHAGGPRASEPARSRQPASATRQLRQARTCYDHLAGVLGVTVTEALLARRALVLLEDGAELGKPAGPLKNSPYELGPDADAVFASLGVDLALCTRQRGKRLLLRSCVDWTERRPHLAGHLGATLASTMMANGWVLRHPSQRSVELTPAGRQALAGALGVVIES